MENTVTMRRDTDCENPVTAGLWRKLDLFTQRASLFHRGKE